MKNPSEPRDSQPAASAPARRQWSKPEIVVYGHLAKLTRGTSGMFTESGGMTPVMSCL